MMKYNLKLMYVCSYTTHNIPTNKTCMVKVTGYGSKMGLTENICTIDYCDPSHMSLRVTTS